MIDSPQTALEALRLAQSTLEDVQAYYRSIGIEEYPPVTAGEAGEASFWVRPRTQPS